MIFDEIFHDFGWYFATRIRIRFIEADPDPADQNETDPNGSGCETLKKNKQKKTIKSMVLLTPHGGGG